MKSISLLLAFITLANYSYSQSNFCAKELSFSIDNDVLLVLDEYYTAGHFLTYRKLFTGKSLLRRNDSTKLIQYYRYGNKIFTPKTIGSSDTRRMDRPYAGWNFISSGFIRFQNANSAEQLEAELGVVGPASGMVKLQEWWHDKFNLPEPKGWNSQIRNEVVLNLSYKYLRSFTLTRGIELMSQTNAVAGTGQNRISQQLILRAGDTNSIRASGFFNGRLGSGSIDHDEEFFLYGGWGLDYVLSNIFIEGSLFHANKSPYTLAALPWVRRTIIGLLHTDQKSTFILEVNFLSKEIERASKHGFVTITYSHRW